MRRYSPYQYATFRIILGIYLVVHFLMLIPYAQEVFSNEGTLANNALNFTYGVFPGIFDFNDSAIFVQVVLGCLSLFALLFALGWRRQLMALLLWFGWVSLFDRNNLISNPGIPFIGWLLLISVFIPKGEKPSLKKYPEADWVMPGILFVGAWIIMSVGYTISGIDKFAAPSWRDGSAIFHLLENPLARDWWLREFCLTLPKDAIKGMTWAILGLEIAFLPMALLKRIRGFAWLSMVLMHFGILSLVDFADLTTGMLMIHIFTFDPIWLKPAKNTGQKRIVFFDGVCGLCNTSVDLLMKEDQNLVLQFAPLQGQHAKDILGEEKAAKLTSIHYYDGQKVYDQSGAVIRICRDIGGFWKLALILFLVPAFIRNPLYNYVAKNRYKWFGKRDACRIPTPEERNRILD